MADVTAVFEPADVFFGAYPKSGTTWARFVLFEMLSGKASGFKATNQQMPGVGLPFRAMRLLPGGGRLIATHEYYRKDYQRSIYMVRDARDVLLSEYAFLKALDFYHDDLDKFVPYFSLHLCKRVRPLAQEVAASWLDSPIAGTDNMLVVRYEDLRRDPVPWFARMGEFLGVDVSEEQIKTAVANNSIQSMRARRRQRAGEGVDSRPFCARRQKLRGWVFRN